MVYVHIMLLIRLIASKRVGTMKNIVKYLFSIKLLTIFHQIKVFFMLIAIIMSNLI